jgi:hypothetical protein
MRLSEWRAVAPTREALGPKVTALLDPVLAALGAERDPNAFAAWGDDPGVRYSLFVLVPAGLAVCAVRPVSGGEGPRLSTKLVRWGRIQVGEVSIETQSGHRLLTAQIEGQVLKGVDAEADRIARFMTAVAAGIDGRPMPRLDEPKARRRTASTRTAGAVSRTAGTKTAGTKPAATKPAAGSRGSGTKRAPGGATSGG